MRKLLAYVNFVISTLFLAGVALAVSPFDRGGETVHKIARLWASISLRVSGVSVRLEETENIGHPPYLLMSNHQGALDIRVLLAGLPIPFKFIAKRELFRIPVFGWAIRKAGYISIDRQNPREALKAIEEAVRRMNDGTTVLIFPEGTRSNDSRLLPFKKGAFSLASRAEVPILPLAIIGSHDLQPSGSDFAVPKRTGTVTIRFGKPIEVKGKGTSYKAGLKDEVYKAIEGLLEQGGSS
jgi:1-acyl-sn-glycerol-3-phosphate acyltransferase